MFGSVYCLTLCPLLFSNLNFLLGVAIKVDVHNFCMYSDIKLLVSFRNNKDNFKQTSF